MNKLFIAAMSSLLLANTAFAVQATPSNSFFQAVLEEQAAQYKNHMDPVEATQNKRYSHANDKNNSLVHAVLAKQGVYNNIVMTSKSQIRSTHYDPHENNNSLFRAALSRHYQTTH